MSICKPTMLRLSQGTVDGFWEFTVPLEARDKSGHDWNRQTAPKLGGGPASGTPVSGGAARPFFQGQGRFACKRMNTATGVGFSRKKEWAVKPETRVSGVHRSCLP